MGRESYRNLLNLTEAKQKSRENLQKLLEFLYAEKYSKATILQEVIGLQTRSAICRILRRMERQDLVRRHQYVNSIVLWGITPNGIHDAIGKDEKITDWTYFEPSKINLNTLEHQFDVQKIHALCIRQNIGFIPGRTLGSRVFNDKVPDGIIIAGNNRIAVEVERSIKSKRRYDGIIYNYLKAIKAGKYTKVLYVAPTPEKCQRIKKVFYDMGKITMKINGVNKLLKLSAEKHLKFFEFIFCGEIRPLLKDI
jgi:hypothetical protein